jgi:hypothetical protein
MPPASLEERVTALEQQVATLLRASATDENKSIEDLDWRSTIGMFSGNEIMKQIDELGQQFRKAERKIARKTKRKPRQTKP